MEKKTNNYVAGRNREFARLDFVRRHRNAKLGGRFRGSKLSQSWINILGFNPKLDLWWVDSNGVLHFEQLKTAQKNRIARISRNEVNCVQGFADIFHNFPFIWVGYVIKNYRQPYQEVRLN